MIQPLTLTFGNQSVTVSGLSAGGDVLLFCIAKEPSGGFPPFPMRTRTAVVLHDEARVSEVTFQRERPLPRIGIWVAIEMGTGHWVASGSR